MGKKVRSRTKKTSSGQRPSISSSTIRLVREGRSDADRFLNKLKAWRSGKKGWVTIANPNHHETDKPFIKVSFDHHFGKGRDFKTIKFGDNNSNSNRNDF